MILPMNKQYFSSLKQFPFNGGKFFSVFSCYREVLGIYLMHVIQSIDNM